MKGQSVWGPRCLQWRWLRLAWLQEWISLLPAVEVSPSPCRPPPFPPRWPPCHLRAALEPTVQHWWPLQLLVSWRLVPSAPAKWQGRPLTESSSATPFRRTPMLIWSSWMMWVTWMWNDVKIDELEWCSKLVFRGRWQRCWGTSNSTNNDICIDLLWSFTVLRLLAGRHTNEQGRQRHQPPWDHWTRPSHSRISIAKGWVC